MTLASIYLAGFVAMMLRNLIAGVECREPSESWRDDVLMAVLVTFVALIWPLSIIIMLVRQVRRWAAA